MKMKKKSKFIFNEFKSIMLNEFIITDSLFAKIKVSNFIKKFSEWNFKFKSFKVRMI